MPAPIPILTRSGALVLTAVSFNVVAPIAIARFLFGVQAWPLALPIGVTCAVGVVALLVRYGFSWPRESVAAVVERRALEAGAQRGALVVAGRPRLAGVRHTELTR